MGAVEDSRREMGMMGKEVWDEKRQMVGEGYGYE